MTVWIGACPPTRRGFRGTLCPQRRQRGPAPGIGKACPSRLPRHHHIGIEDRYEPHRRSSCTKSSINVSRASSESLSQSMPPAAHIFRNWTSPYAALSSLRRPRGQRQQRGSLRAPEITVSPTPQLDPQLGSGSAWSHLLRPLYMACSMAGGVPEDCGFFLGWPDTDSLTSRLDSSREVPARPSSAQPESAPAKLSSPGCACACCRQHAI